MRVDSPVRRLPQPEGIRDFFTLLLGRRTTAKKAPVRDLAMIDPRAERWVSALYLTEDDELLGACVAEIALAANAGAALAMITPGVARESVAAGTLSPALHENYLEVADIVSVLLNEATIANVHLEHVVDGIPPEVLELVGRAKSCRVYDVRIEGYGGGAFCLIA
jgi:hypothetical protein